MPPTPQLKIMAQVAPETPIDDVFGTPANVNGDEDGPALPDRDVPAEVAKYIRGLPTTANATKLLKSAAYYLLSITVSVPRNE